jgi:D-arabinose 1-dehydrogenase-like Zn-dependent alcohol dehydrogenase
MFPMVPGHEIVGIVTKVGVRTYPAINWVTE